jgi:hypothetical protein
MSNGVGSGLIAVAGLVTLNFNDFFKGRARIS